MSIAIEKGIPIPAHVIERKTKYPFAEMNVGDSIFVTTYLNGAKNAARQFGGRRNMKFVSSHEDGGLRIWRTA